MIFYLEDNKKWTQLMHFFKTCVQSSNPTVCFLWNSVHGWLLMQNSEFLSSLDSDHLVLLAHFRLSYFSSFIASPNSNPFCRGLDRASFSLDISKIYSCLRSLRSTTKRVMFSISLSDKVSENQYDPDSSSCEGLFIMKVFDDYGVMEITRNVTLNQALNQTLYFRQTAKLSEETEMFLELSQSYLKNVKEFRNCILSMKFHSDHISIESPIGNQSQDLILQINKSVCKVYNYSKLATDYDNRNRLLVPPNFLVAQSHLATKLNQSVQMYISDEIMDDGRIMVYLMLGSESYSIVSAFATILDYDNPDQDDTQQMHRIHQKPLQPFKALSSIQDRFNTQGQSHSNDQNSANRSQFQFDSNAMHSIRPVFPQRPQEQPPVPTKQRVLQQQQQIQQQREQEQSQQQQEQQVLSSQRQQSLEPVNIQEKSAHIQPQQKANKLDSMLKNFKGSMSAAAAATTAAIQSQQILRESGNKSSVQNVYASPHANQEVQRHDSNRSKPKPPPNKPQGNQQKHPMPQQTIQQQPSQEECQHAQAVPQNFQSQTLHYREAERQQYSQMSQIGQSVSDRRSKSSNRPSQIEVVDDEVEEGDDQQSREPFRRSQMPSATLSSSSQQQPRVMSPIARKIIKKHVPEGKPNSERDYLNKGRSTRITEISPTSQQNSTNQMQSESMAQSVQEYKQHTKQQKQQQEVRYTHQVIQEGSNGYSSYDKKRIKRESNTSIIHPKPQAKPSQLVPSYVPTESKLLQRNKEHTELAQQQQKESRSDVGFFKSPVPVKKQRVQQHIIEPISRGQFIGNEKMQLISQSSSSCGGFVSSSVRSPASSINELRTTSRERIITKEMEKGRGFFNVDLFPVLKQFESYNHGTLGSQQSRYRDDQSDILEEMREGDFALQSDNSLKYQKSMRGEKIQQGIEQQGSRALKDFSFEEYEKNQNYGQLQNAPSKIKSTKIPGLQEELITPPAQKMNKFETFLRQNRNTEQFTVFSVQNHQQQQQLLQQQQQQLLQQQLMHQQQQHQQQLQLQQQQRQQQLQQRQQLQLQQQQQQQLQFPKPVVQKDRRAISEEHLPEALKQMKRRSDFEKDSKQPPVIQFISPQKSRLFM